MLKHATISKIEGIVNWISQKGTAGFIKGDDGADYFLDFDDIIDQDQKQPLIVGRRVKFYPVRSANEEDYVASAATSALKPRLSITMGYET